MNPPQMGADAFDNSILIGLPNLFQGVEPTGQEKLLGAAALLGIFFLAGMLTIVLIAFYRWVNNRWPE